MSQRATEGLQVGFWHRQAWKFLLGLAIVIGLFGVGDILRGLDADPAIAAGITGLTPDELRHESETLAGLADFQVRAGGMQLLVLSLMWVAILLTPFRRGERWAWYAMWTFPTWASAVSVAFLFVGLQPDGPIPPPAVSGWIFFVLSSLLLVATRNREVATPTSARE